MHNILLAAHTMYPTIYLLLAILSVTPWSLQLACNDDVCRQFEMQMIVSEILVYQLHVVDGCCLVAHMYSLLNRTMIVHGYAIESNIGRIVVKPGNSFCRDSPTFLVHPIEKVMSVIA